MFARKNVFYTRAITKSLGPGIFPASTVLSLRFNNVSSRALAKSNRLFIA